MNTHNRSGQPFDLEELLNEFAIRLESLHDFASLLENAPSAEVKALCLGIALLRTDYQTFDRTVRQWDAREHGTEYIGLSKAGAA